MNPIGIVTMNNPKQLNAIDRLGSIQGAAKELKMSYRAIWGRIKATEERLNRPLLIRNTESAPAAEAS